MRKGEQIDFPFLETSGSEEGRKKFAEEFHHDEQGRIIDREGNVYDEHLNLIQEAPNEALLEARKIHPDWSDPELLPLTKIIERQTRKKQAEKK